MSEERIRIIIREDGSRVVIRNINDIGGAAARAQGPINGLAGAMTALAATLAVDKVRKWIDTWTSAKGKVNIFTHSVEETNMVLDRLVGIAQDTRQPLDATVNSFHQLTLAASALGASQNRILDVSSSVNKVFAIQGTTAMTARGGIIQFGQAMTEGIVRAQEYNSMINAMPLMLKVVAQNLEGAEGSVAKLRKIMLAGKLTSKAFFDALEKGGPTIQALFERSGKTIGQAMTILDNAMTQYIGKMDTAIGFSATFFKAAKWGADNIQDVANALIALTAPLIIRGLWGVVGAMRAMAVAALMNPWTTLAAGVVAAVTALGLYRDKIILIEKDQVTLGDFGRAAWDKIVEGVNGAIESIQGFARDVMNVFETTFGSGDEAWNTLLQGIKAGVGLAIGLFNEFRGAMFPAWELVKQGAAWLKEAFINLPQTLDSVNGKMNEWGLSWDKIKDAANFTINLAILIKNTLGNALDVVKGKVNDSIGYLWDKMIGLVDYLTSSDSAWGTFSNAAKTAIGIVIRVATFLGEAFDAISTAVAETASYLWDVFSNDLPSAISTFIESFIGVETSWQETGASVFKVINELIGAFVSLPQIFTMVWNGVPAAITNSFNAIMNAALGVIEGGLNKIVGMVNAVRGAANLDLIDPVSFDRAIITAEGTLGEFAEKVNKTIEDNMNFDYIGAEIDKSKAAFDGLASSIAGAVGDTDQIGNAIARTNLLVADTESLYSGMFDSLTAGATGYAVQRAADQAAEFEMQKKIAELMDTSGEADDFSPTKKGGAGKGSKGAKGEFDNPRTLANSLRRLLNTVSPLNGATLEYEKAQRTLNAAQKAGLITADDNVKYLELVKNHYRDTVDPIGAVTRELERETEFLKLNSDEREVAIRMYQIEEDLRKQGIVGISEELALIQKQIEAQNELKRSSEALDAIRSATFGASQGIYDQQIALNQAFADGTITQQYYAAQMAETNVQWAELQNRIGNGDFFTIFTEGVGAALEGFTTLASGAAKIIGDTMTSAIDGISDSIAGAIVKGEDLRTTLMNVAQTVVTEMISALIKLGIQYALNAVLGTAMMATQTAASVAAAGTTAAAWAPAAAAVSLASFGTNSVAAIAGMAAANVAAQSFAAVKLPGFKTGGDMLVGGSGGPDSQLISFMASPNEKVSIRKPGQSGYGDSDEKAPSKGDTINNFNFDLPNIVDKKTAKQSTAAMARGINEAIKSTERY